MKENLTAVHGEQKKPRRGARKKRVVDYYDGPDRDNKRQKDSKEKVELSKPNNIVDREEDISAQISGSAHAEEDVKSESNKPETNLESRNEDGNMSVLVIDNLSKKAKVVKKAGRKGKNVKKAEIECQDTSDYIEGNFPANEKSRCQSIENGEHGANLRIPESAEGILNHVGDSVKEHSEHGAPMSMSAPTKGKHATDPDDQPVVSHEINLLGEQTQKDPLMSPEQKSSKMSQLQQCQSLNDGGPVAMHEGPSQTIAAPFDKGMMREDDSVPVFAANMASSVKTLLPHDVFALSDKVPEPKELHAKGPESKNEDVQKQEERQRIEAEKLQTEASELKSREQLQRQKEEESNARLKAKEEQERRKREEKAKRLEEHKRRRKLEAEAAARSGSGGAGLIGPSSGSGGSLAAAKERLAKIQQQAALLKNQSSTNEKSSLNNKGQLGTPKLGNLSVTGKAITPLMSTVSPAGKKGDIVESKSYHKSYEISPYKSDHDSDDDVPKKPVPDWARGKALMAQLAAQMYVDPDEVFQQHAKTCSLDQVFGSCRKPGKQNFDRRSSSGNWIEDRVTWKEEMGYKKAMGYI